MAKPFSLYSLVERMTRSEREAFQQHFRTRLEKRMHDAGVGQVDIARELKIGRQSVFAWTKGKALPTDGNFLDLCRVLKVKPVYFTAGIEPVKTDSPATISSLAVDGQPGLQSLTVFGIATAETAAKIAALIAADRKRVLEITDGE